MKRKKAENQRCVFNASELFACSVKTPPTLVPTMSDGSLGFFLPSAPVFPYFELPPCVLLIYFYVTDRSASPGSFTAQAILQFMLSIGMGAVHQVSGVRIVFCQGPVLFLSVWVGWSVGRSVGLLVKPSVNNGYTGTIFASSLCFNPTQT